VAKADLAKVDLPKNIVDRFSPPVAANSAGTEKEKPATTTTESRPSALGGERRMALEAQPASPSPPLRMPGKVDTAN
jgi:hypothetical protein